MPVVHTGPLCARRGCPRPVHRDRLCGQCWRLARMFGKNPEMFAYEPLNGYRHERDAVELPWESWEQEAGADGRGVADLFSQPRPTGRPGDRPADDGSQPGDGDVGRGARRRYLA